VNPRLEDTLTLAAIIQSLARMLFRLRGLNQRWRLYDRFLIEENRWRAQRYGTRKGLIDFGKREIQPMEVLAEDIIALVAEDADVLGCRTEVEAVRGMLARGTSSERQRAVLAASQEAGKTRDEAMRDVVRHLIEEFHADL